LFLLLTLGGLRELEAVAYNVVLADDIERKERGSVRSLLDSTNSTSLDSQFHEIQGDMEYLSDNEDEKY
jgi:hypothetical protein